MRADCTSAISRQRRQRRRPSDASAERRSLALCCTAAVTTPRDVSRAESIPPARWLQSRSIIGQPIGWRLFPVGRVYGHCLEFVENSHTRNAACLRAPRWRNCSLFLEIRACFLGAESTRFVAGNSIGTYLDEFSFGVPIQLIAVSIPLTINRPCPESKMNRGCYKQRTSPRDTRGTDLKEGRNSDVLG